MAEPDAELTVAQRLGQLLDRGLLPAGGPAEAAERLIERLERPARVALLGLPGAGKSAILNLLTGAIVVPETLRLPTIIVQYGTEPRMLCTLTDGRTEIVPGTDLNDVLALNPALVTVETDLPALKVISLLEVSAGPMEAEQRRAAIWASKRADIVIWCSTSYLPKEQQVWEGMPDMVKDNGFLFLTKVDLLGSKDAADGMLERVEARAGEEFRQVLAISAKQARAAMPPGEPVDREMFRDSGAAAVITTIKSRVQAARRADTDMAELLLLRHVEASGIVATRFADPVEAPAPNPTGWAPPPEAQKAEETPAEAAHSSEGAAAQADLHQAETNVDGTTEPVEDVRPAPAVEPEPEAVDPVRPAEPDPAPVVEPDPVAKQVPETKPEPPRPVARPGFTRPQTVEPEAQPTEGRKRFSDRIKQMPVPEVAPTVPLRTTWKSKADMAAARNAPPQPESPAVEPPPPERRPEPRPRATFVKEPEPQDEDTLAKMLASVARTEPEVPGPEPEPEIEPDTEIEAEAVEDEVADEEIETDEPIEVEDDSPRWAERLKPMESDAAPDRAPRMSLFGSRKPAAASTPGSGQRPVERAARPTEPVTRVRAPAPRPADPPRPAIPTPEELATPRMLATRERPQAAADPAEAPQGERRERRRITATVAPSAAPALVEARATVPAAEQDLLESAVRMIVSRSADLAATLDPDEKIPVDMILDHSRETVEQVIALLGPAKSAGLKRILGDLGEIQDIIMLMQLEKGHAPADDALTLILQIRRDLETLHAA